MGSKQRVVLMVDDDPEDILLTRDALREVAPRLKFKSVNDGQELTDYLARAINSGRDASQPFPELVFLDLNMPRKSGFEVLGEMRSHPVLKRIPVVIWSTSTLEGDVNRSFDMGANSFISKPQSYDELLTVMSRAVEYWFGVSRLPSILPR
jgi:CheY-like chemotaxis protein